MKPSHAIQTLWEHAGLRLPDSVLAQLAGAEDSANALRNIARLMEGLGGLIEVDAGDARPTEIFRDSEGLPGLLFGLAAAIETQAELVAVASDAAALLRLRGEAEAGRPPGGA